MKPATASDMAVPSRWDRLLFFVVTLAFAIDTWRLLDILVARSPQGVPHVSVDRAVVIVGTIALLVFAGLRGQRAIAPREAFFIGAIAGALFFVRAIGCGLLDPTNIAWLMRADWATHYGGWAMFREAPWTWPLGTISTLMFPMGTSVVYTDSLPILALPLKLFDPILPRHFQYIGFWLALGFTLQGAFGALLVRRVSGNATTILVGALLLAYSPILLNRIGHDALDAHWLILAGIWLYFRDAIPLDRWREALPWWLLILCAALVHPYLTMMMLALAAAYAMRRVFVDHARSARDALLGIAIAVAIVILAWWMSGAFRVSLEDGSGGVPYGVFTFNMLSFFDSGGLSWFVPRIPGITQQQWEGSAYLGIGIIVLLAIALLDAVVRRRKPQWRKNWPLILIAVLLTVYAASTVIMLGPWKLLDWPSTAPLLSTFRASGRFIWVPYYLIIVAVIWQIVRVFPRASASLLMLALAAQSAESWYVHLHFAGLRSGLSWGATPEKLLTDADWSDVVRDRHHVTMMPPLSCGQSAGSYLPFQMLAIDHGMTFNSGYVARASAVATLAYCTQLAQDIAAEAFSGDDVYVVGPDLASKLRAAKNADCGDRDGYLVCVFPTSSPAK